MEDVERGKETWYSVGIKVDKRQKTRQVGKEKEKKEDRKVDTVLALVASLRRFGWCRSSVVPEDLPAAKTMTFPPAHLFYISILYSTS